MFNEKTVNQKSDSELIIEAARDYIEGWYDGDEERMSRALHPRMTKRRLRNGQFSELDTMRMVYATKRGGGTRVPKETYEIEVEILDKRDTIASVISKSQYIDYLHLAKVNDKWRIINVLWDIK